MPDHLPWVVRSDKHVIALVKGTEKTVMTVADVMCDITKTRGITEVHVADHDLSPTQKDWYPKKRFHLNVLCWLQFEFQQSDANTLFFLKFHATWQEENGTMIPRHFRYDIKPKAKIHAFKPKELNADAESLNLRSSVMGAFFHTSLDKLPASANIRVVWEAGWFQTLGVSQF